MENRNQIVTVVLQYSKWRVREKMLKMTLGEYYARIVRPRRYATCWQLETCGSLAERKKGFRVKEVIRKRVRPTARI